MTTAKEWSVHVYVSEHADVTRAEARLTADERQISGSGAARRNPKDTNIPKIGDELAAARALSDLAHQLLHLAAEDIEGVTHQPVHLQG